MWPTKPNRSRSGPASSPARVVAPTSVNGVISSGMAVAPGPFPTTTSTRKSSIAMYSSSSAGRAMRWISSMNNTSPGARLDSIAARSPDRSIAGPLVIFTEVPSSEPMMSARLVLPSPGGPDSRTWSGGRPRRLAPSRTRSSCRATFGWPMKSASECGRRADSTTRSSSPARGSTASSGSRPGPASWAASPRSKGELTACLPPGSCARRDAHVRSRPPQQPQRLAQQDGDLDGAGGGHLLVGDGCELGDRALGLLARPAQPDEGGGQLVTPRGHGRDREQAARGGGVERGVGGRAAQPVAELQHQPLGALLADPRHLHERLEVAHGDRPADLPRWVDGEHGLGQPWAHPVGRLQQLEQLPLVVVGEAVEGQGVL